MQFNTLGSHSGDADVSSAVTLIPPSGATKLLMQTMTQNVRFTLDGTAPTASIGFQLKGEHPAVIVPIGENTVVKVIQEAATADFQYQFGI